MPPGNPVALCHLLPARAPQRSSGFAPSSAGHLTLLLTLDQELTYGSQVVLSLHLSRESVRPQDGSQRLEMKPAPSRDAALCRSSTSAHHEGRAQGSHGAAPRQMLGRGTHRRQKHQPRAPVQAVWCGRALLTTSHKADKPQEPRSGAKQASWEHAEPDLPAGREPAALSPPAAAGGDTQPVAQLHSGGAQKNPVQTASLGTAKPPQATR